MNAIPALLAAMLAGCSAVAPPATRPATQPETRPATLPATRPDDHLLGQTFLWPYNFLTGRAWEAQGMTPAQIAAVLARRLPPVDAANGDQPAVEVLGRAAGRAVLWVPAPTEKAPILPVTYRELVGDKPPPTVGELLQGLTTGLSEFGGLNAVLQVGRQPRETDPLDDHDIYDKACLIYAAYVTQQYIAIVALPADNH